MTEQSRTSNRLDEQYLTDQEIETIGRFKAALQDMGVQGELLLGFVAAVGDYEAASSALRNFATDIDNTPADVMGDAAVSLNAVVRVARRTEIFPPNFLPTEETVEKCIANFWADHRGESD